MGFFDVLGGIGGLGGMFDQAPEFVRGLLAQAQQQGQGNPYGALAGLDGQPPMPPQRPMQLDGNNLAQVANPEAPQPPVRPKGLLGMEDAPAPQAQTVQGMGMPGASPQASGNPLQSIGDLIGGIYGKGGPGDGLIALGAGLMSKRRFGEGLQSGLDNMQRQQLIQAQTGQANQKLAQSQAQLQSRVQAIKSKTPDMPDANAAAVAANDSLFQAWAKQNIPGLQADNYGVVNGYYFDKSDPSSGAKPIPGMPVKSDAPSSIQEYEYAKKNGYEGSFQDWQTQGGGSKMPATVAEYEYAKKQGYAGSFEDWQKTKAMKFANFDEGAQADLIKSLAARARAGDTTWKTGLARDPGLIRAVEVELARQGMATPEGNNAQEILQNRANQQGRVREQATLGTSTANNTLYGNAAAKTIDTAIQASREVPRTNWVPVNKLLQLNEAAISDPKLAAFRTALMTTVNDYAKATTPTGTPTDSQRNHAYEVLNTAVGPEGVEAVLRMMHREIANTHSAIDLTKTQLQSGKGGHLPDLTSPLAGPNVPGSQATGLWDSIKNATGFGAKPAPAPSWRIVQ